MKIKSKLVTTDNGNYTVVLEIEYVDIQTISTTIKIRKEFKELCSKKYLRYWDFLQYSVIEMFKHCSKDLLSDLGSCIEHDSNNFDLLDFLEILIADLDFIPELMF